MHKIAIKIIVKIDLSLKIFIRESNGNFIPKCCNFSCALVAFVVDKRVISAETFYHPMSKVWHSQDGGETTVMQGSGRPLTAGNPVIAGGDSLFMS